MADALRDILDRWPQLAGSALALCLFVTAIAYVHRPRLKALIYSMPVPFTCAYFATGMRVNATHLTGLALVVGYSWVVYLLRDKLRLPIAVCIGLGVAFYVAGAVQMRPLVALDWPGVLMIAGLLVLAWLGALRFYRARSEPGHRSRAPWWIKMPLVFVIALVLFSAASLLKGAVFTFPYAGVFTSYEMRKSLRTLAGQFTLNAVGFLAMIVVVFLTQGVLHRPWPLALGWITAISCIGFVYWRGWGRPVAVIE